MIQYFRGSIANIRILYRTRLKVKIMSLTSKKLDSLGRETNKQNIITKKIHQMMF